MSFKALAHPVRRSILNHLRQGPKSSGELADLFPIAWPTMSRHLTVLREADLIIAQREGNVIRYFANASVLEDVVASLLSLLPASANMAEPVGDPDPKSEP